jgi:hypothetical protein
MRDVMNDSCCAILFIFSESQFVESNYNFSHFVKKALQLGLVRSTQKGVRMPRILLKEKQLTGQFRCSVDSQVLANLDNAVAVAKKAGLVVDYRADVEALLKRMVKAIEEETKKQSRAMENIE